MKILFLGDYSNLHGTLATYLRGHGHEVTLVSDGCRCMDLESDIRLARRRGLFSGYDYLYKIMWCSSSTRTSSASSRGN